MTKRRNPSRRWLELGLALLVVFAGSCEEYRGRVPPNDHLFFPAGMAIHPSGRYLYVVNTNFDVAFDSARGGTVAVVDTDTLEVVPESTVRIGSFGGRVALSDDAQYLYVAVRGDDSVVRLEVLDDGRTLRCQGENDGLRCRFQLLEGDPYAVAVEDSVVDLELGGETRVDLILVTHLLSTDVTAITTKDLDPASQERLRQALTAGGSAMARHPRTGDYYLVGRFDDRVRIFRPVIGRLGNIAGLFSLGSIPLANPLGIYDSRDIAFSADGDRAYVSARLPGAVMVLDTSVGDRATGTGSRDELIGHIDLDAGPETLAIVQEPDGEYLYVAEYGSNTITVVDPRNEVVVEQFRAGQGPTAIVVDQTRHQRLYVSLFSEDAVGVIDIDPDSLRYRTTVAKIR